MRDPGLGGARRPLVALATLCATSGAACERPEGAPGQSSARASASAAPHRAPRAEASAPAVLVPPPKAPCRVTVGSGTLEPSNQRLEPRGELDGERFVSLASGERLSLRHERTTRELTLHGPGRFLPCARGDEQVLVVEGGVTSTLGVGARAGGEVLLATPFGLLRYGDAALDLKVEASRLSLSVAAGEVVFESPPRKSDAGPKPKVVRGPKGRLDLTKRADPALVVERCRSAETKSRSLEKPPRPAGSARAPLGTWAVASFEARRSARLACALEKAVLAGLPAPERRRLEDQPERPDSARAASPLALPTQKK